MAFPPGGGNLKLGETLDPHSALQPLAPSRDLGARRVAGSGLHLHIRTLSKACQSMKRLSRSLAGLVDKREGAGENCDKLKIQHGLRNCMNNSFQAKRIPAKEVACCSPSAPLNERTPSQLGGFVFWFFPLFVPPPKKKKMLITLLQAVRCN